METKPTLRVVASEPASDDQLMVRAAAGERAAFATIVARHQAVVVRLCATLVREQHLAEEIAQEVFVRLWQARARYRPEGKLRPYLFMLARNLCRSEGRKQKVRRLFLTSAPEPRPSLLPDEQLSHARLGAVVAMALDKLPENYRLALIWRYRDELSYDEIAAAIGRTPETARSRVHLGLKALAELLPKEVLP